ncbi:MAG: tRNA (N(6)-L-threonylcarbamoyladenosine(37)-C(2))-methylthiotransferase MtaB [Leptospiraceae bacterium]|nr:tRNA (N(6)-L-threonylcarbamoyladenosine(37)-C(2))-methylthiotransferase MtaB [Leptospiraceae bacterium]
MLSEKENGLSVSFYTLGCRLNVYESDGLASILKKFGYKSVALDEKPNVVVVNTCTVTNKADSKNRNIIRSAIKTNPGSQIWVTGCYAQTDKEIIEKIPGVTGVVGNSEKSKLPYYILEKNSINYGENPLTDLDSFSYSDTLPDSHTRAYLKIQDGCNRKCSYCKIPQARGAGLSRRYSDVLDQVKFLQDNGIGEIVLTGVNIGWYKDESIKFIGLLNSILKILEYSRLRISSIEPSDVGTDLAEIFKHPRFCNYLHVPLQSGSSKILKLMKRSYFAKSFRDRIEKAKSVCPDLFLGTDVICGFPGESEEDFLDTVSLLKDLEFAKIHAFPFSARRGTLAEKFGCAVSHYVSKSRVRKLMELSRNLHGNYARKNTGKRKEAILENDGFALTDNYLKVDLRGKLSVLRVGQFIDVELGNYVEEKNREGYFSSSFQ